MNQPGLFPEPPVPAVVPGPRDRPACSFLRGALAGRCTLERLRADLPLEQRTCVMYGRRLLVPRLECWFGSRAYRFGGRLEQPQAWTPLALELRGAVEALAGTPFDSCFVNYYRNGEDAIGWHADDDPWIGPTIASLSFGAARRFVLRQKDDHAVRCEYELGEGDLLVMLPGVQKEWQHHVPRQPRVMRPRINLTFRSTIEGR